MIWIHQSELSSAVIISITVILLSTIHILTTNSVLAGLETDHGSNLRDLQMNRIKILKEVV